MKINNFQGELPDISAKKEALCRTHAQLYRELKNRMIHGKDAADVDVDVDMAKGEVDHSFAAICERAFKTKNCRLRKIVEWLNVCSSPF